MTSDREKPTVAFWVAVVVSGGLVLLPILYVASFGPACCLADRGIVSADEISAAYPQIFEVIMDRPLLQDAILGYASICGGKETATEVFLNQIAASALREEATKWNDGHP